MCYNFRHPSRRRLSQVPALEAFGRHFPPSPAKVNELGPDLLPGQRPCPLPLAHAHLCLLDGDLIDVGQRVGARSSFDGFQRDVLHLPFRLFELLR